MQVQVSPAHSLKLLKNDKNISVACFGYGKPRPSVLWKKGADEVPAVEKLNISEVVQIVSNTSSESPWNVTSYLYLRIGGVTYEDAGNYTCQVYNGVALNSSLNATVEVLCEYGYFKKYLIMVSSYKWTAVYIFQYHSAL